MPLILLSNDDGIDSPGLRILAATLSRLGRIVIVAPEHDNSAASHSLTMRRPLRVRKEAEDIYAVDGTPADCMAIGLRKLLVAPPDLVVTGINPGANIGDDIHYSGTVSAARESTLRNIPSLAVSCAASDDEEVNFASAAEQALLVAERVLRQGLPTKVLLNINVPNLASHEIKGHCYTRQGKRHYENDIQDIHDPKGRVHYWIGGGTPKSCGEPGTDMWAVARGFVSISPLHLDMTSHLTLEVLRKQQDCSCGAGASECQGKN